MELGLFLMPLHYPHRPHFETYEEDLELMAHADRLASARRGLESISRCRGRICRRRSSSSQGRWA